MLDDGEHQHGKENEGRDDGQGNGAYILEHAPCSQAMDAALPVREDAVRLFPGLVETHDGRLGVVDPADVVQVVFQPFFIGELGR